MKIIIGIIILLFLAYAIERMEYEKDDSEYEEEWFVYFLICSTLRFCFIMWSIVTIGFMGIFD